MTKEKESKKQDLWESKILKLKKKEKIIGEKKDRLNLWKERNRIRKIKSNFY